MLKKLNGLRNSPNFFDSVMGITIGPRGGGGSLECREEGRGEINSCGLDSEGTGGWWGNGGGIFHVMRSMPYVQCKYSTASTNINTSWDHNRDLWNSELVSTVM
jgi:hypothetical protein